MSTEVWFRNPYDYVRELVECETGLIAWDRGLIVKRRIDPVAWADLYFGETIPYRMLMIGDQGSAEVGYGHDLDNPIAVYPTWSYGDDFNILREMMESNVGDDPIACSDYATPVDSRPVLGQEHRVVVSYLPRASTLPGRTILKHLKQLQEDFPQCILHVHGLYSYRFAFGMNFGAADVEPRSTASMSTVILASGALVDYRRVQKHATWVTALGMKPADLEVPRMRCMFNIRSALWAGKNYTRMGENFASKTRRPVDYKTPTSDFVPDKGLPIPTQIRNKKAKPGDKTLCDMCSLQLDCKQFRSGGVCSLEEGKTVELARFFKTRDSGTIIEGLSVLMAMQSRRLERAAHEEAELDELSPEVTKMVNSLFSQGVTLAKLVDPTLRGTGVKVNVGVINGTATASASINTRTPAELTGEVVRALELQGIPRNKITAELVMATIEGMRNPDSRARAIEGTVIAEGE